MVEGDGGLPQATANEKTHSDYLQVAREAEKVETVETSQSSTTASTSKPRTASFFPLWKLKGRQLAITPSTQMAHLEEKSANKEEGVDGEDPDGIKGMMEEFIVCLARAVKDTQKMEKCCYHW